MLIHITRFRCIDSAEYAIQHGKFTLLKGDSGAGKTTLLESVNWCLYGSMTHVYPSGTPGTANSPTVVELTFPECGDLKVQRSKPPELLTVTIPSKDAAPRTLTGAAAESYVVALFGTRQVWVATSYIHQGERSPLMILPNSEKMELLRELTFGAESDMSTESPDAYLKRLDIEQKNNTYGVSQYTTTYNTLLGIYTKRIQEYKGSSQWKEQPTPEGLAELREQLQSRESEIVTSGKKLLAMKEAAGKVTAAQTLVLRQKEDLASLERKMSSGRLLPAETHEEEIRLLQAQLKLRERQTAVLANRSRLETDARRLADLLKREPVGECPDEIMALNPIELGNRVARAHQILNEFDRCSRLCQQQAIVYDKGAIDAAIAKVTNHIASKRELNVKIADAKAKNKEFQEASRAVEIYRANLAKTDGALKTYTDWWNRHHGEFYKHEAPLTLTAIDRFREDLRAGKQKGDLYVCPECTCKLEMRSGTLVKAEGKILDPGYVKETLDELHNIYNMITTLERLQATTRSAEERLVRCVQPDPELLRSEETPNSVLDQYTAIISQLRDLTYPCKEEELSGFRDLIEQAKVQRLRTSWIQEVAVTRAHNEQALKTVDVEDMEGILPLLSVATISSRIIELQKAESQAQLLESQIQTTQADIVRYKQQCGDVTVLEDIMTKVQTEVGALKLKLKDGEELLALGIQRKELEAYHAQICKLASRGSSITRVKTRITDITGHALQELVDQINTSTNLIVSELFADDIIVTLRLSKENKTDGKVKSQVNMQIHYKGHTYDNPNSFSGGERDRLSLALTLALARVGTSPVLFLDECMASLPNELRDSCIRVIRRYLTHKTVVNICHETVEGYYDEVVQV